MPDIEAITNFLEISENLGTSGMPGRDQFSAIAAAGYQVVINLARDASPGQLPDEEQLVTSLGMEYIHIPVAWENPQQEDLQCFFQAMDTHLDKRIFVHCVANYRVSVFVYLYRIKRLGVAELQAWEDLTKIWTPDDVWKGFISSYDHS